jgi:multicomponent Na+:H+ antiporter subunit D
MSLESDLLAPGIPWVVYAIAIPLVAALAAIVLGMRAARLALPAAAAACVAALLVVAQVYAHGTLEYAIGGWSPPLGIKLRIDGLSASFLVCTAIVVSAIAVYSRPLFGSGDARETRAGFAFWPLLFFAWAALNVLFSSADLFNLYVALELLTLSAVAMVALDGKADSLVAAMRYLLFALFGSLAYLLGVALLYGAHGALDMQLLRAAAGEDGVTLAAGALITAGLMAKTALFPLHAWLPPAHAGAPAPASALLSALVVKGSFYLIVRLWFDVLPMAGTVAVTQLFGAFGAAGIVIGSWLALRQARLKMIVAYSTVAQLGYLFLMFPLAGGAVGAQPWAASAWTGGIYHALAHAPAKAALFLAAGVMMKAVGHDRLSGLVGIARDMPLAAFAFGLGAVSLMGLPPSGGFTAKYLLLTAALASGQWWWAAAMIVGGLLAAAYLFRVLNRFLQEPDDPPMREPAPRGPQVVALVLAGISILMGLLSHFPYHLLQIGRSVAAAEGLS